MAVNTSQRAVFPREWCHTSYDLPIPASHNAVAAAALVQPVDFVLFVEEDMLLPFNAIDLLLAHHEATGAAICVLDYPVGTPPQHSSVFIENDEVLWCGLGCTLISRRVFEMLDQPWFSASRTYRRASHLTNTYLTAFDEPVSYGGLDIDFCIRARAMGFSIALVPGVVCGHIKIEERSQPGANDGTHVLRIYDQITYQKRPEESEDHFLRRANKR